MPLGAHLPTSKGFLFALDFAKRVGCDCLQVFSKSPRQWAAAPLDVEKAAAFRKAWKASGFAPLVAHNSYLINLAAPDEEIRAKAIAAMIDEVQRADMLGCDYLVTHCGSHLNREAPLQEAEKIGIAQMAASLKAVHAATPKAKVKIALENTCGQGTVLGGPFEHIGAILKQVKSKRLAVCVDTCHAHAYGHDIVTPTGLNRTIEKFDDIIGLQHLAVIHLNDSKGTAGSHLDRHEHIGQGQIGREAMRRIVTHPQLKNKPFILETPEVETMVETNLNTVRELRNEK